MSALRRAAALALVAALLLGAATAAQAERPESPPGQARSQEQRTHGQGASQAPSPERDAAPAGERGNADPQPSGPVEDGGSRGSNAGVQGSAHAAEAAPAEAAPDGSGDPSAPTPAGRDEGAVPQGLATQVGTLTLDAAPHEARGRSDAASAADSHGRSAPATGGEGSSSASTPRAEQAAPALRAADGRLDVRRAASGNVVGWSLPDGAAGQVQLWRLDGDAWVPLATATSSGMVVDDAPVTAQYRLTWSHGALGGAQLDAAASALALVPADAPRALVAGPMLAWVLLAGAVGFATVRAPLQRRVLDAAVAPDTLLLAVLSGLPGIDQPALQRLSGLGLRTVGQLRALDPDAVAFWSGVPAAQLRRWQDTVALLQWPALPAGAAERLALAGHATLAEVAAAEPEAVWSALTQAPVVGPGLPSGPSEVAAWVAEARQMLGLALPGASPAAAARVLSP